MTYSLNEIAAICKRAARGAGLSWGLAEEAGYAARWLAGFGLPGPAVLATHLPGIDGADYSQICPQNTHGLWQAKGRALCPLITGAAICDLAGEIARGRAIKLGRISNPMLLLPFVAAASSKSGTKFTLCWGGLTASFCPEFRLAADDHDALICEETNTVSITAGCNMSGDPVPRQYHQKISPKTAAILGLFGHRTYAPDTAQSRLSGAGAGLSDND